jgi:hypothetical protein
MIDQSEGDGRPFADFANTEVEPLCVASRVDIIL